MLIIQAAAAVLLLLGSGLIFKALVEMDAPSSGPRSVSRRSLRALGTEDAEPAVTLRKAA